MTTTNALANRSIHEIAEGNTIELQSTELAIPMSNVVLSFQELVSSLTKQDVDNTKIVKSFKNSAVDLQTSLSEFSSLYTLAKETGDSTAISQAMTTEINYLADENDISSLVFFMEGYQQQSELVELPELDQLLDFTHTNVLIGRILHRSQRAVGYTAMKKVLGPIIDEIDIEDLLDNALSIKDEVFMKSLAFNIVRYIIDQTDTTGVRKNEITGNIYTQFEDIRNGVFLVDGPLIELLEKILDYDIDLYNDIVDRISTYNHESAKNNRSRSKNKQKIIDEYIFDASHIDLAISTAQDLKEILDKEILESNEPKKIKRQYGLGIAANDTSTTDVIGIEYQDDENDENLNENEPFIQYGYSEDEWSDSDSEGEDDDINF